MERFKIENPDNPHLKGSWTVDARDEGLVWIAIKEVKAKRLRDANTDVPAERDAAIEFIGALEDAEPRKESDIGGDPSKVTVYDGNGEVFDEFAEEDLR